MANTDAKSRFNFSRAFELAYFIHANKDIAFFVAEDALDELTSMLGKQERNRRSSDGLRGFLKLGERSRPTRKTLRLTEQQMLQWLVYKQSEPWERQTEAGKGLYLPTEEDLIVRYIKQLTGMTLRRGSFYVTLAAGPLLNQFDRRETRLVYDTLIQGDSARMKDTSYIGKQRLELMDEVCQRFGSMIRTEKGTRDERHFVTRPADKWVVDLVDQCLRRFSPWDTTCVIEESFSVTDIPGLYFSGPDLDDEDSIEMNRIHTLLHPKCFARFVDGLAKFVHTLPADHQDRSCDYSRLSQRLAVPLFSNLQSGTRGGDRFQAPALTQEDFCRLVRTLDARSRRSKALGTYRRVTGFVVDGILSGLADFAQRLRQRSNYAWLSAAALALLIVVLGVFLMRRQPRQPRVVEAPLVEVTPAPSQTPLSPLVPPQPPKEVPLLTARAAWSADPQAILRAVPIEPTRSGAINIDLSTGRKDVLLSLPIYDAGGRPYTRFRISIIGLEKRIWQKVLRAPSGGITSDAHVLNLTLSAQKPPRGVQYDLRVEGLSEDRWQGLGHVPLNLMVR